jgi:uncharacterized protein (DUF488 family)
MAPRSPSQVSAGDALPVFTIGHSTRTILEFVTLLRAGQVQLVIDIRRMPRSRANPQYNIDALPDELAQYQIDHMRIAELGGLRKKLDIAPETNGFWTNRSFHNYADYALTDEYQRGFDCLVEVSTRQRAAIMCAEAVWWRCHRRIVADYLINAGRSVYHLMGTDEVQAATLTSGAVRAGNKLHYPASKEE